MPITPGEKIESAEFTSVAKKSGVTVWIDDGGSVITTGVRFLLRWPDGPSLYTIEKVTLIGDPSGSTVIDLWVESNMEANGFPTAADSICGSDYPSLSSDDYAEKSSFTGWTLDINPGSVMAININSLSTITKLGIAIDFEKTET